MEHEEFDYCFYFEDGKPDAYRYCVAFEEGHAIYHRFTIEDYEEFGFRKGDVAAIIASGEFVINNPAL